MNMLCMKFTNQEYGVKYIDGVPVPFKIISLSQYPYDWFVEGCNISL